MSDQPLNTASLDDSAAREAALHPLRSFIVQAPAGSGKTELLTWRILTLLTTLETPEELLAITFTRKAAAEMRDRVLEAMEGPKGANGGPNGDGPLSPVEEYRYALGRAAMDHSRARGWALERNPNRLRISTIDGFAALLVNRMPWLSRLGGVPTIAEEAGDLYAEAARRTLRHLEEDDRYGEALARVLAHFDNRAHAVRDMLVELLRRRDQWLRHRHGMEAAPEALRAGIEAGFARLVADGLETVQSLLAPRWSEWRALCGYAGDNLEPDCPLRTLAQWETLTTDPDALQPWQAVAGLFLTDKGEVRKTINKHNGFPAGKGEPAEWKARMLEALAQLRDEPRTAEALHQLRSLPAPRFTDEQWDTLAAVVELLDLATANLWLVMTEERVADFTQVAGQAQEALGRVDTPSELLLALDRRLRHLLVDEFQDTSFQQFRMLELLLSGWEPGDGRTLFLVGDPMQSIYRFREADVTLFQRARDQGIGPVKPESLQLAANFRSDRVLTDWFNENFAKVFPPEDDEQSGAVSYAPCRAATGREGGVGVSFRGFVGADPQTEAVEVADEVERWLAEKAEGEKLGILARSRSVLPNILRELALRRIQVRGEELNLLANLPWVLDVRSLTVALLDPADRLAWLSLLRAPWCGLPLADLHALAAHDPRPLPLLLADRSLRQGVSPEGQKRLERVWPLFDRFLDRARRLPLRELVEGAWTALGAPAFLDPQQLEDVDRAFALLETLDQAGTLGSAARLDDALERLFSTPSPELHSDVHVMTIHKAKGLQFDTVLLPGLGKKPRSNPSPILAWAETTGGELLAAPRPPRMVGAQDAHFDYLRQWDKERERNEWVRLLYVAATRAKRKLMLWGHCRWSPDRGCFAEKGSLLNVLWPVFGQTFDQMEPGEMEEALDEALNLTLLHLPDGWTPPSILDPPLPVLEPMVSETEPDEPDEPRRFEWASEVRKHVGTVAHDLFERMAGEKEVDRDWVDAHRAAIRTRLSAQGVPPERLDPAVEEVARAARSLLADETGRWIIGEHPEAHSEFEISGISGDDTVERRRIDRTFVDKEGMRWIIDYKVSPHEGSDEAAFFRREKEAYRPQLESYVRMFRQLEPERTVRAALYYPLQQRLVEVA